MSLPADLSASGPLAAGLRCHRAMRADSCLAQPDGWRSHAMLFAAAAAAALMLGGCAHQPDAQTLARVTSSDAALQAGAERAVLDASAFDAARQRTPAPARTPESVPAPAAAKPAAPEPRRLAVPFAQGSTRLDAEQTAALRQLGKDAERGLRWRVTTRIEAAGSPIGNRRLARARADRVIDQLVRAGIGREAIALVEVQASAAEAGNPQQSRRVDVESVEG